MAPVNGIRSTFFGMHLQDTANDKPVGYGSIRLWDTGTTWRDIELQKGKYSWTRLDQFVEQASSNGIEILYTLGQPPLWATTPKVPTQSTHYNPYPPNNIKDWKDYVTAVAKRYKGKIKYYEVWNEPNLAMFYAGTVEQLVQLTKEAAAAIKLVDNTAIIVSPCYTGLSGYQGLASFLAAGGKYFIDIIGVHLYCYPSQPERMISLAQSYRQAAADHDAGHLPIWNTESTWNNFYYKDKYYPSGTSNDTTPVMPSDLAISYLLRMYLCNWAAGMERCFFYGMESTWSSIRLLTADRRSLSDAGYAYKLMTGWFDGATMTDYEVNDEGVHSITFMKDDRKGFCLWTTDQEVIYGLHTPDDWAIVNLTRANGDKVDGDPSFYVDKMPILLDSAQMNRLLPKFKDMDDSNGAQCLTYNSDFAMQLEGTAVPSGWNAGAMQVAAFNGTDAPVGSHPVTLLPNAQYQGLRQTVNIPLVPGACYEMSVLYKLPAQSVSNEWMFRLEAGTRGSLLEASWGSTSNTDQNDETGSGVNLAVQPQFAMKKAIFLYDVANQTSPSGGLVQIGVINRAPSGQNKPISIAGMWLKKVTQVDQQQIPTRIYYLQAIPKAGSFGKGDQILFANPDVARTDGYCWICSVSGTLGALSNVKGTVAAGSAVLTVNTPEALQVNNRIQIGSDASIYTVVLRQSATQFELHAAVPAAQSNQDIRYVAPEFIKLTVPRIDVMPMALAVGASPFVYANAYGYAVEAIIGGSVTKTEFSRDGINFLDLGMTNGSVTLSPKDQLRLTYAVIPKLTIIPR